MGGDYLMPVARWLTEQSSDHHQLRELAVLVDGTAEDRRTELEAVRAVVERFDKLGLVAFHHHVVTTSVMTWHRGGLRRIAAGEQLATVAQDVEAARPVTIVRIRPDSYAAWYRSPLQLPAGATAAGVGGVCAATPDEALAALRAHTLQAALIDVPTPRSAP